MSILNQLKKAKVSEIKTEFLSPFNLEDIYNASKRDVTKSPFPLVYLTDVEAFHYASKDYTLLPGVVLSNDKQRPTIEQVTPESIVTRLRFSFVDTTGKHGDTVMLFMSDKDFAVDADLRKMATLYKALGGNAADLEFANLKKDGEPLTDDATLKDFIIAYTNAFNTGRAGKPVFLDKEDKPILLKVKFIYTAGFLEFGKGNFVELPSEKVSGLTLLPNESLVPPRRNTKPAGVPTIGGSPADVDNDIFP